jgi:hypothetical protein
MTARPSKTEGSPAFDSYTEAMAWVQANLPHVHKDGTAQVKSDKASYTYKYADLADVSQAILTLTGQAGLAWTTKPTMTDGGVFALAYAMRHTSGESEEGVWPLPNPSNTQPQAVGSAITYARRYALCAVTGVAPDKDDDGQAAQQAVQREQRPQRREEPPAAPPAPKVDEFTAAVLEAVIAVNPDELARVKREVWSVYSVTPDLTVPDPMTGESDVTARALLMRAASAIENEQARQREAKAAGAAIPEDQWQTPLEGDVEDGARA